MGHNIGAFLVAATITSAILLGITGITYMPTYSDVAVLHLVAPTEFNDINQKGWDQLEKDILSTSFKNIQIEMNGYGGDVEKMIQLAGVIGTAHQQGKRVVMKVTGVAYSAHAFILCYADKVIRENGSVVTFHPTSMGDDPTTDTTFLTLQKTVLGRCISKGFLSLQEVLLIANKGKRIVIFSDNKKVIEENN